MGMMHHARTTGMRWDWADTQVAPLLTKQVDELLSALGEAIENTFATAG